MTNKTRQRACLLCIDESKRKVVLVHLEDPKSRDRYWLVPGGKIEEGESPSTTALREALEEAGVIADLVAIEPVIVTYPFEWNGNSYECVTTFYAGYLRHEQEFKPAADENYILARAWFNFDEAIEHCRRFPQICAAVQMMLANTTTLNRR